MGDEPSNGNDPENRPAEFERFEALTKRLVAVPKSEVDAKRKKLKAQRKRTTNRA